jgi:hypothetical protein
MSLPRPVLDGSASGRTLVAAGFAAALCVMVTVIHLQDQHWFSFAKEPGYVQVGYVIVEVAGLIGAALLVTSPTTPAWVLAAGVGIGPLVGYVLSRGPGLPNYTDDIGNWGEPLGVVSLIVEGLLTVVAVTFAATTAASAART